jgi:putative membrane protein
MKPTIKLILLAAAGLLATIGGSAIAQTNDQHQATGQPRLGNVDKIFMMKAEQSNIAEIKSSQMALTKASKPGLKDFAQRMIDDHATAENDLKQLAQQKGYRLPSDTDAKSRAMAAKLMKLNGAAFDSTYSKAQHDGHVATIAVFKNEIANGNDPNVKAYAEKYLPKIEGHLQALTAMNGSVRMHRSGNRGSATRM